MGNIGKDWDERELREAGRLGKEGIGRDEERMEGMEMNKAGCRGWEGMRGNIRDVKEWEGVG